MTKYAIFTDGSTLRVVKNPDGILSTVTATAAAIHGGGSIAWIHAAIDSADDIHVVSACVSEQTRDVAYAVYDCGTDSFGAWTEAADYDEQAPDNPGCAIGIDGSDYPRVLFVQSTKVTGATGDRMYYTHDVGSGWITPEQVDAAADNADFYDSPTMGLAPADDVEALYRFVTNGDAAHNRRNGSWGTESVYTETAATIGFGGALVTTGDTVYRYHVAGTNIEENDVDTGHDTHSTYNRVSAVLYGTTRYVFYIDANQDIHLISNSGASWVDEGVLWAGTYQQVIAEWAYNNEHQANEISYIFDDGTNVYHDSFSLAATVVDSITADAIVEKTVAGSFTADAIIKITVSGSITADAMIVVTTTDSITADAVIYASSQDSITADATILLTQSSFFTTDAAILVTISGSITADAIVLVIQAGSITADALIYATTQLSITADAIIKSIASSSFTADAAILVTKAGSVTADATILASIQGSITADATIYTTNSSSFTADAYIAAGTIEDSITADAIIKATVSGSFTIDAYIVVNVGGSLTADAVIQRTELGSITTDAVILKTQHAPNRFYLRNVDLGEPCTAPADNTALSPFVGSPPNNHNIFNDQTTWTTKHQFHIGVGTAGETGWYLVSVQIALIAGELRWRLERFNSSCASQETSDWSATYTTTGIKKDWLRFEPTWNAGDVLTLTIQHRSTNGQQQVQIRTEGPDSYVEGPWSGFVADAVIQRTESGSYTADAIIQRTESGSVTSDATILATTTDSFVADATILSVQSSGITADAIIKRTESGSVTADAIIEKAISGSVTADATILFTVSGSITADAIILVVQSGSFTTDATVYGTQTGSITADVYIVILQSDSITADAIVKASQSGSITADATIEATQPASITADATIEATQADSFTADTIIEVTESHSLTVDARICMIGVPVWLSPPNSAGISTTPVLVFQMPSSIGNMHFCLQLDTADTFDTGNLREHKTNHSQTNWEHWDGDSWEPFPATGVPNTESGNNCRFTVTNPLSETTWYRRVWGGTS